MENSLQYGMKNVHQIKDRIEGYIRSGNVKYDLIAGLVTGSVLVPQSMSYALLANLSPVVGLYSGLSLVVYSFLGSSSQLSVAPVAMASLLVSQVTISATTVEQAQVWAGLIAFYAGITQLLLGITRIGTFLSYWLSKSMLLGYTTGVAITIVISQLPSAFGFKASKTQFPIYNLVLFLIDLPKTLPAAIIFFLSTFTLFLVLRKVIKPKLSKKWSFLADFGTIVIVVSGTAISYALLINFPNVIKLPIVGTIPAGYPPPILLEFSETTGAIIGTAIAAGFIGFLEGYSVAKSLVDQEKVSGNRELIAIGSANIIVAFFNGYSVSGGLSRTLVNVNSGATSQISSLVAFCVNLAALFFLSSAMSWIPNALLAAVIISAVLGMIKYEGIIELFRISKSEFFVSLSTVVMVVCVGPMYGLCWGLPISIIVTIYSIASPHIAELGEMRGGLLRNLKRYPNEAKRIPRVVCVRVDAPMFFANVIPFIERCQELLKERQEENIAALLIDASGVGFCDITALNEILRFQNSLKKAKIQFALAEVRGPVRDVIRKYNEATKKQVIPFYEKLPTHHDYVADITQPIDQAQEEIHQDEQLTCFSVHSIHEALDEIRRGVAMNRVDDIHLSVV